MLAADMVRGEASAPLSTLLAAEQQVSLMMLVWDRQQGVQENSLGNFPRQVPHEPHITAFLQQSPHVV